MRTAIRRIALLSSCLVLSSQLFAEPKRPECIAPAKPGGGFDLTCKLAQSGLKDEGLLEAPMRVTYMPGGVGAVAYNAVIAQRAA
ncbi:MAG TPA: tricarboxylic transporter, partial [Pseudomonas sp.]|nr:tricarboxylic transporter [Pseudomonas sp.]